MSTDTRSRPEFAGAPLCRCVSPCDAEADHATTASESDRGRWLALYVLCAGVLMIVLDTTIVNVALPTIQDDLGFSSSNLAWVVNAYLIAFGGLLLLAGRIGDLIGSGRSSWSALASSPSPRCCAPWRRARPCSSECDSCRASAAR
jgi:hypothetical protein